MPDSLTELARRAEYENYRIELIKRFVPSGRLLEIGPAYGILAYLAKSAGFDVDVIEMDEECCTFLSQVVGVNVIQSSQPHEVLKGKGPYDVIVIRHVIEHLAEPWKCLQSAAESLTPGGILCITTPNPDALQFRLLGSIWSHIDAPRHLQLFPKHLMVRKLSDLGLALVFSTFDDRAGLDSNRFGWRVSLANLFSSHLGKKVISLLGEIISLIISPVERINSNGSTYTLVVRKTEQQQ